MHVKIHPSAIVHPGADLGAGVEVGPYCVVGPEVRIGDGTVLHNHVTIQGPTTVGAENVVYPFAVLGADPQDLKFKGYETCLEIGDRNKIREHVTIHRGTEFGGGRTVIGSDCLLMVGAHVAHDCVLEDEVVIANGCMIGGHCLIEYGATLGGGAGIHHFATVGALSFVGGMARITKDVPPYMVVEGAPAEVRKVNTTALMRRRWAVDEIERLRIAFKAIYRNPEAAIQTTIWQLRADPHQTRAVKKLCDFLERTQEGVHGRHLEVTRDAQAPRRPDAN